MVRKMLNLRRTVNMGKLGDKNLSLKTKQNKEKLDDTNNCMNKITCGALT